MKISKSEMNTNKTSIPHFQGLVNIDEKVIPKLISKMDIFELQKTEAKLILEDQRHAPIEKKSLKKALKKLFSRKKVEQQKPVANKTLQDFWDESINEIKLLVTTKLPEDYVLTTKKPGFGSNLMSFKLSKGEEYIYGVSTSITNPKSPLKGIKQAVERISDPKFEINFKEFKKIIPELSENTYIIHYEKFSSPKMLKWIGISADLNKAATAKKLKTSIQFNKNDYSEYRRAKGVIKNEKDEIIYETPNRYHGLSFEEVSSDLADKLKTL